jgi:hypothetical protein
MPNMKSHEIRIWWDSPWYMADGRMDSRDEASDCHVKIMCVMSWVVSAADDEMLLA